MDRSKEFRENLASVALGVKLEDLRKAINTPDRHPKMLDEKWSNQSQKQISKIEEDTQND